MGISDRFPCIHDAIDIHRRFARLAKPSARADTRRDHRCRWDFGSLLNDGTDCHGVMTPSCRCLDMQHVMALSAGTRRMPSGRDMQKGTSLGELMATTPHRLEQRRKAVSPCREPGDVIPLHSCHTVPGGMRHKDDMRPISTGSVDRATARLLSGDCHHPVIHPRPHS